MISFACPACNKRIKVRDDLAGMKGKCPSCGKPTTVPQNVAAGFSEAEKRSPRPGPAADAGRTLGPKPRLPPDAGAPTLPPSNWAGAGQPMDVSVGETIGGVPHKPCGNYPPELTAFLARRRQPTRWAGSEPTGYWGYWATAAWVWSFERRTLGSNAWLP